MHTQTLATRFARNTFVARSETPLLEDQMRHAAPSIFATAKHVSRSERYTYIPTIEVLRGLRKEGFEPFMVAQSKSQIEGKTALLPENPHFKPIVFKEGETLELWGVVTRCLRQLR